MKTSTAVLLLNMGGPDKPESVGPFLYNLFSDPEIISLPGGGVFQNIMAWGISSLRTKKVKAFYRQIGGGSPILPLTRNQADALTLHLQQEGLDVKVYIGMRYWFPFIEDAVKQMMIDNIKHVVVLPLYPQYSSTTTGSSINQFKAVMSKYSGNAKISIVSHYHNHPVYLAALADTIEQALVRHTWECSKEDVTLLFSAHSLPEKFVKKTGDPYPVQVEETVNSLAKEYFPDRSWYLSYQSRVGPIAWLKPSTEDIIHKLATESKRNILVVPVSFVSDHLETLYEIDIMYYTMAKNLGISCFNRSDTLNTHPLFIKSLAEMVKKELHNLKETALAV